MFENGKPDRLLIECKVKKEPGVLGFKSFSENEGIPGELFEELKPVIDTMVNSYYHGVLLEPEDYEWIDDSANKTFEEWAKEKGLDPTKVISEIEDTHYLIPERKK